MPYPIPIPMPISIRILIPIPVTIPIPFSCNHDGDDPNDNPRILYDALSNITDENVTTMEKIVCDHFPREQIFDTMLGTIKCGASSDTLVPRVWSAFTR